MAGRRSGRAPFLGSARLLALLLVACLLLAAAVALGWARSEGSRATPQQGAISSVAARDAALEALPELTERVLSYSWESLESDAEAARKISTPSFRTRYDQTLDSVRDETLENRVTLTASAKSVSVVTASERKVVALVFVDQTTTARATGGRRVDQNRVLVTLTADGGEWRVSRMDAF